MENTKPRHILRLTTEEKRQFLDSFDTVLSDIDGVVWSLKEVISGAGDGLKVLKDAGKPVMFITNNSLRPMENVETKFKTIGLDVTENDIWHPAKSIVAYLKSINFEGLAYVIGSEVFKNYVRDAGFNIIDGPNRIVGESFGEVATSIFDREPVRAVVIDVDFNLSAIKLIRAQQYLNHPDCQLIAGATDQMLNVSERINIIGPGAFLDILITACKKKPLTFGKPGKELADMLTQHLAAPNTKRVLMIGDMMKQDISFARTCNFQSLLVLSGCTKLKDMETECKANYVPDYYAESLADFVEFMTDLNKANV